MNSTTEARTATTTVDRIVEKLPLKSVHYYIIAAAALGFMFDSFDTYIASYAMPSIIKEWKLDTIMVGTAASAGILGNDVWRYSLGAGHRQVRP